GCIRFKFAVPERKIARPSGKFSAPSLPEATLTSLTRRFHAGKRWLTGSVRKRAVTSLYRIKEELVVTFSKPTSRDSDRMSLTPASWFRHLPEVAELGERWRNIVCMKLGVSVFGRCNSTSSLQPTEQPCVFGKILDSKSSASCRALSAIAGAGLSMFM